MYGPTQTSELASKMIKNRLDRTRKNEQNQVGIDHLAFTFKLADLRYCSRAGYLKSKQTDHLWPSHPDIKSECNYHGLSHEKTMALIETEKQRIATLMSDFYLKTLHVFCREILGFNLSAPRDRGFHGYQNSMNLVTHEGTQIGFVGIGGQRDTCYIQISGEGCKHLWSHTTPFVLHHWLSNVLQIRYLARVDLAYDCYDGNFDCKYAETAFYDNAFARSGGGRSPTMSPRHSVDINGVYDVEMVTFGKRTSPVFWRIYNKKLEQGIQADCVWYRNEVELKKYPVETLLNPDAAFAGLCRFAQSMIEAEGINTTVSPRKSEAATDLASRARWVRRMCGKALSEILEMTAGDIQQALGYLIPDEYITGKSLDLPNTYKQILTEQFRSI
ncbi:replication initiation factor family protein [Pseudoalteromonas rubra]|uniref:Replication initiation factor family protein n=1 Tax=Pseudoalteromonas rubra TaxID=43658 RepID=A0A5S3WRZ8_9GAMM|nr:replication initiation factor domain-containing protein [Pseudoalteromonas rubra]TMP30187.1 replication initiation factor family protein [Pseudoalteromonas rubra]TMP31944.1 replication initiation factor family protein [Pseudoalteromonas rubra]